MTTIKLKNGSGAPAGGDLVQGEPALDLTNKRLYTENASGTVIEVGTNPGVDVTFADNRKAIFGAGSDLQIYHDGSNSYIENTAPFMLIESGTVVLRNTAGTEDYAKFNENSDVKLYFDNSQKFATTATGIDVTGTLVSDGLTMASGSQATIGVFGTSGLQLIGTTGGDNVVGTMGSSEPLIFRTVSAERMRIDSSGNAIFTKSGGAYLQLKDASAVRGAINVGTSDGLIFTTGSSFTERMRIDSSGRLNVGQTSAYAPAGGGVSIATFEESSNSRTNLVVSNQNSGNSAGSSVVLASHGADYFIEHQGSGKGGALTFTRGTSEAMRIDSSGNVGIGTTSPFGRLSVDVVAGAPASSGNMTNGFTVHNSNGGRAIQLGVNETGSYNYLQSSYVNNANVAVDMAFFTGATERMRIDTSGNVGIGCTPASTVSLDVQNLSASSNNVFLRIKNSTNLEDSGLIIEGQNGGAREYKIGVNSIANSPDLTFSGPTGYRYYVGTTEAMRIDSSGNVGIGVTPESWNTYKTLQIGNGAIANYTPTHDMRIVSNAYYNSGWKYAESDGACLYLQDGDNSAHIWSVAASGTADAALTWSEAMRIDSSGNLLVGTTTSAMTAGGVRLKNGGGNLGEIALSNNSGSADYVARFLWGSSPTLVGNITVSASATAFNTSSDQRLKDNIADAPSASDDIDAIQVRSFDWKADGSHQKYGMVAQELNTVAPEAVSAPEDPEEMMGVDYSKLVPMLVKEIQSLRARVAQLETN